MNTALLCLVFFAFWTVGLLVFGVAPYRVSRVLIKKTPPNGFPSDVPHGPDMYRRIIRAHANCVENLPVFAAVVLVAAITQRGSDWPVSDLALFNQLAVGYVCARVGQSLTHVLSGSNPAINVRFTFFLAQIAMLVWMGYLVVQHIRLA